LFLIYDPAGQFVAMVELHQNLTVSEGGDLSLPNLAQEPRLKNAGMAVVNREVILN
jgi:hypothetical protein